MSAATNINYFANLRGKLRTQEPMSRHTSWRVGGNAEYFYTPADRSDLQQLMQQLPEDMPVTWVGLGSNLLVRDEGIKGVVISTLKGLDHIAHQEPDVLYAEAGVSSAKVAKQLEKYGLTGVEFLAGVPGTFGGALAMNAGAFGGETWDWVESIELMCRGGDVVTIAESQIKRGYRHVELPDNSWIVAAKLKLSVGKAQDGSKNSKEIIRDLLNKRSASQPVQTANAGSVFTNPKPQFAAQLIEQCGLKGFQIGGAEVSVKHANFIVNMGDATASDIENLITHVRTVVKDKTGVNLTPEVRMIGGVE